MSTQKTTWSIIRDAMVQAARVERSGYSNEERSARFDGIAAQAEKLIGASLSERDATTLMAWSPDEVPQDVFKMAKEMLKPLLKYPFERTTNNGTIRAMIANVTHRFSGQSPIANEVAKRDAAPPRDTREAATLDASASRWLASSPDAERLSVILLRHGVSITREEAADALTQTFKDRKYFTEK